MDLLNSLRDLDCWTRLHYTGHDCGKIIWSPQDIQLKVQQDYLNLSGSIKFEQVIQLKDNFFRDAISNINNIILD